MLMIDAVARHLLARIDFRWPWHFIAVGRGAQLPNSFGRLRRQVSKIWVLVGNRLELFLASEVFANGDVFHLRRNDSLIRIPFLRDGMPISLAVGAVFCSQRLTFESRVFLEPVLYLFQLIVLFRMRFGEVTVVFRFGITTCVLFNITSIQDPLTPKRRESLCYIAIEFGIPPRSRTVIHSHGFVFLNLSVGMLGVRDADFAHRHFQSCMNFALDIDPGGVREERRVFFNRSNLFGVVHVFSKLPRKITTPLGVVQTVHHWQFWRIHCFPFLLKLHSGKTWKREYGLFHVKIKQCRFASFVGMTRIRFEGLFRIVFETLSPERTPLRYLSVSLFGFFWSTP